MNSARLSAVIRTTAELALRRARAPDAYRDSLQEIAAEAERMTALVEDLLILARSDAGAVEMPLGPVDLREILRDVLAEIKSLAEFRRIHISLHRGEHQPRSCPETVLPCTACSSY